MAFFETMRGMIFNHVEAWQDGKSEHKQAATALVRQLFHHTKVSKYIGELHGDALEIAALAIHDAEKQRREKGHGA